MWLTSNVIQKLNYISVKVSQSEFGVAKHFYEHKQSWVYILNRLIVK